MRIAMPPEATVRSDAPVSAPVRWLAWSLALLALLGAGPMIYLETVNGQTLLWDNILSALLLMVFAWMGALVAARCPGNPVGWLLCLVALLSITGIAGIEYAVYGLVEHPGSLPGAYGAAIIGGIGRSLGWEYMLTLVPLYFPNGRLLSARWRWVVWSIVVGTVALIIGIAFTPFGDYTDLRLTHIHNPIALISADAGDTITGLSSLWFSILLLVSACSVALRFRRARGVERQQLKWFVYAMAIGVCGGAMIFAVMFFSVPLNPVGSIWFLIPVGMPIATGIAILRHRLYDIDIIINRTLVYGSLTVILAALYFGLVIGAQTLTGFLTGKQVDQPPAVIVLTTLLVAALFQPLRAWLQRGIDHRFYRSRYDAAKTVAAFSASLLSEVDLSQLNERLLAVVEETMRPAHVSLWLRQPDAAWPASERAG